MKHRVVMVAVGVSVVLASMAPAQARGYTLRWSGQDWWVLDTDTRCCAGPNLWEADNVSVDADGHLHMKIAKVDGAWRSAELVGMRGLGYGTYRWTIRSPLSAFDPNAVLGLFVYGDDPAFAHREIDIEFSAWAGTVSKRGQFAIQPDAAAGHRFRYGLVPARGTYSFRWEPGAVTFTADWGGAGGASWTYRKTVPPPLDETPRMNFWLFKGDPPMLGKGAEVVIEGFEFLPPRKTPKPAPKTITIKAKAAPIAPRQIDTTPSQPFCPYRWVAAEQTRTTSPWPSAETSPAKYA